MTHIFKSSFSILCALVFLMLGALFADNVPAPIKDPATLIHDELARLDTLIQATQQSLEGQKKLREKIVEYQKLQEEFAQNPKDNDVLLNMVKSAHRTLQAIKENHLTQTFDTDFIDELTVLSQPASKRGIPKP